MVVFFLGIGGIGMSALARYFHHNGCQVAGYDRTPSALTRELEAEGMTITYADDVEWFRALQLPADALIVRTPAVPEDNLIFAYIREHGYTVRKRSEVLGMVTREKKALCVAGTHGKTTTSTMLAHLMQQTEGGVNAFLGGVSMNYRTNVLIAPQSDYVVVEADEYDRSFHQLTPYISVVTAVDADHLDIYGTEEAYREAFAQYTSLITGALVMKYGIALQPRLQEGVGCYTYGVVESRQPGESLPDFYADRIRVNDGRITFDFHTPETTVEDVQPGVPVWVNIENTVAAMAVAWLVGKENPAFSIEHPAFREAVASFQGVWRRFNIHINTPELVYIDDYAHHPEEIATAIDSVRKLYPNRHLIGVFQPHLYTRTRDFASGFARVLGTLDECLLLPIYPAREEPIPGVNSEMLGGRVVQKAELVSVLKELIAKSQEPVALLTVGAGDIDRLVPEITRSLE